MVMARMRSAAARAAAGLSASWMPPALPRPPTSTWAFTTTRPPTSRAIRSASWGLAATRPAGTGTP